MTLLRVSALSVTLGAKRVLDDVHLSLAPGEVVGVVGASGSGKSMLLAAISGLLPPGASTSGSAMVNGAQMLNQPDAQLAAVRAQALGFVFQEPMTALNPLMRIGAQIAEGLGADGPARAAHALAQVELPTDFADRYPHQLSGGQRQRALIAMAIVRHPKLLLADEPTTALDSVTQADIAALLLRLSREQGCALLLVTHDLALAAHVCDQLLVMDGGKVVDHGASLDALRHPASLALRDAFQQKMLATTPPTGNAVLRLNAVTATHTERSAFGTVTRTTQALRGISFDVKAGETVGLIGPSGCGKSTLGRVILGLHPAQSGTVHTEPPVQVVFQDPAGSLNPRMRVAKIILEPLWRTPPADPLARVAAALAEVGLEDAIAQRFPHQLSGGQRQRVSLARALIVNPKLLILDEALSALDVSIRSHVLELLVRLQRERGLAYLFITHDLALLHGFAQRLLVMEAGEIVEAGDTRTVLAAPRHPLTRRLLAAAALESVA
jgi:peptide/nickel transport system ATP-binding protein